MHTWPYKYAVIIIKMQFLSDPVQRDVVVLEDMFAEIEESTFDTISEKHLTVGDFRAGLTNLSRDYGELYKDFFERIHSGDSTFCSMWLRLSVYWDFYNCALFEQLLEEFGDGVLKIRMQEYLSKLQNFQHRTCLSDFANYSIKITKNFPTADFSILDVKLSGDYMLDDLEKLLESIALKFPKFTMVLKSIKPHDMTVTWAIPTVLAALLKERRQKNVDMRSFHKSHYITSITVDGLALSDLRGNIPAHTHYRYGKCDCVCCMYFCN